MKQFQTIHIFVLLVLIVLVESISSMSIEQANSKDDEQVASGGSSRHKFIVMPSSLSRFLFYNTKPYERLAASGGILDNKRSGSALDMITGVTLGKRSLGSSGSGSPVDFVNWEPLFNRQQYSLNGMPRMYDMRWGPMEFEASSSTNSE